MRLTRSAGGGTDCWQEGEVVVSEAENVGSYGSVGGAKILCIEDEELFGAQLIRWLAKQGFQATHALTAAAGLAAARVDPPSLVLLDWNLDGVMSGLEACRELRRLSDVTTIVMLTGRTDDSDVISALDAGADEYLVKPVDLEVLSARIRALVRMSRRPGLASVRPESARDPNVISWGPLTLYLVEHVVVAGGVEVRLTASQERILARLMRADGELVSNGEIWNDTGLGGPVRLQNIRFHVKEVRKLLAPLGFSIRTVAGHGYALEAPGTSDRPSKVR